MRKQVVALILSVVMAFGGISPAVAAEYAPAQKTVAAVNVGAIADRIAIRTATTFPSINAQEVFVKQSQGGRCTLASVVMMLRRESILKRDPKWKDITEDTAYSTAWMPGAGVYWAFSYKGMNVNKSMLTETTAAAKKKKLISLLKQHPEGIVLYRENVHAVLLTDYTNGEFYCAEPNGYAPKGRIKLSSTDLVSVENATSYWYITNPVQVNGPVDIPADEPTWLPAPTLQKINATKDGIQVSWKAVSGASSYRLLRKTSTGSWQAVATITDTSYVDTTAKRGTTYAYSVRCMNSLQTAFVSDYSPKTKTIRYVRDPEVPFVYAKNDGLNIIWTAVDGAGAYRIYRKGGSDRTWKTLGDTTNCYFSDTTAEQGRTYRYSIRCLNSGKTQYTSYFNNGTKISYLASPKITAAGSKANGVKIKWAGNRKAGCYQVFRRTAGTKWKPVGYTTRNTFYDKSVKKGVTYYYTIRCLNADKSVYLSGYRNKGRKVTYH